MLQGDRFFALLQVRALTCGQVDALLSACWEETLEPGPCDFGDEDLTLRDVAIRLALKEVCPIPCFERPALFVDSVASVAALERSVLVNRDSGPDEPPVPINASVALELVDPWPDGIDRAATPTSSRRRTLSASSSTRPRSSPARCWSPCVSSPQRSAGHTPSTPPTASASKTGPAEPIRALAFGQESRTLWAYIDWAVDQARRKNEIDVQVEGDTDDEKAKSRVRAMLEAGLAEKL